MGMIACTHEHYTVKIDDRLSVKFDSTKIFAMMHIHVQLCMCFQLYIPGFVCNNRCKNQRIKSVLHLFLCLKKCLAWPFMNCLKKLQMVTCHMIFGPPKYSDPPPLADPEDES